MGRPELAAMEEASVTKVMDGLVAIVTGAGRGLGLEIAKGLAAEGAIVLVNGRNREQLARAVDEIGAAGGTACAAPFDVTDDEAVTSAIGDAVRVHGRLDVLINNVGIRDRRGLFEFTLEDVRRLVNANLIAPFHIAREAARWMIKGGEGGRIVNISSIASTLGPKNDAAYTAAKAGLEGLTRALAAELGQHQITVNAIAPGFFATETNSRLVGDPAIATWLKQRTALGRWGKPSEITGAAVFLASPAASYVTGHVIVVDGGYVSHA
jgi:gluconate 5-dehydrogenase